MPASLPHFCTLRRCGIIAAGALLLSACATEPPPVPPAELVPVQPTAALKSEWRRSGYATGRSELQPLPLTSGLYVASRSGVVQRLNRADGKPQWSTSLEQTLGAGVAGDGSRVYVSTEDGVVYALDAETGEELWTQTASSEVLVPVTARFGAVVVRSADGRVVALEPDTGAERWSVSFTPPALTINGYSRPVVVDGGVLLGLDDGRVMALALDTGRVIWESIVSVPSGRSEVERLVDIDGDIQIDDEAIYLANYRGRIVRLEPAQGNIVWSTPMSSSAGVLLSGDKVYVVNELRLMKTRLWWPTSKAIYI